MECDLIGFIVMFVLATYLGASLIGRVPPTLHTPLMSGANAVSGITVVGALLGRRAHRLRGCSGPCWVSSRSSSR